MNLGEIIRSLLPKLNQKIDHLQEYFNYQKMAQNNTAVGQSLSPIIKTFFFTLTFNIFLFKLKLFYRLFLVKTL